MSIVKNYIYNTLYQAMMVVIPLITMPYLTSVFSPEQIGLNSYTLSIVNYFMLFGVLGMQLYGNRQVAYVRDNSEKLRLTFWSLYTTQLITSTIALILYYIFVFTIVEDNRTMYLIQGLNIVTVMIDISWLFIGLEEFKKVVTRNTISKVIGTISIFVFVKDSNDLLIYTFITAAINIFSIILMWGEVVKYAGKIKISIDMMRKTLKPLLKLFLPQIASQVYMLLTRTMIGVISTNDQVAFYDYSQKIVRLVLTFIGSFGVVLMPRVSNIMGNDRREEVSPIVEKSFGFVTYISMPITIGLMCISTGLISWFLEPEYIEVGRLTGLSALIIIAVSWANIIGVQYLIGIKEEYKYTISIVIAAIISFIANIILIKPLGALGATISLVLAEFIGIFIQIYLVRKQLNIVKMLKSSIRYLISSMFMGIVVIFIGNQIENSLIANIVQVLVGIIVYVSIMYIIKDPIQKEAILKIKALIKKQ